MSFLTIYLYALTGHEVNEYVPFDLSLIYLLLFTIYYNNVYYNVIPFRNALSSKHNKLDSSYYMNSPHDHMT